MRLLIILFFFIQNIYSQPFDKKKSFTHYADKTIITSQVRSEGNKAILRGSESKKIENLFYQITMEFRYQYILHGILGFGQNKNQSQFMI